MADYNQLKMLAQASGTTGTQAPFGVSEAKDFAATLSAHASRVSESCVEIGFKRFAAGNEGSSSPLGYYSMTVDGHDIGTLRARPGVSGNGAYGFSSVLSPNEDHSEPIGMHLRDLGVGNMILGDKLYQGLDKGVQAYAAGNVVKASGDAKHKAPSCVALTM